MLLKTKIVLLLKIIDACKPNRDLESIQCLATRLYYLTSFYKHWIFLFHLISTFVALSMKIICSSSSWVCLRKPSFTDWSTSNSFVVCVSMPVCVWERERVIVCVCVCACGCVCVCLRESKKEMEMESEHDFFCMSLLLLFCVFFQRNLYFN